MKKILRIVLIVVGILLIVALVLGLIYFSPIFSMKPIKTGEIADTEIIAINNLQNDVFAYDTGDGYILIDTGSNSSTILKSLSDLSINPDDVKYIFMTHTDSDHVATLGKFSNAIIYMSEKEKAMVDGTASKDGITHNSLPNGITLDKVTLVPDGEKIEIGEHEIECISTPGHTSGSMSYLLDEKYLFTGDAFKVDSEKVMNVHPFTMDKTMEENSINKIKSYFDRCEMVFTSHYGYFNSDELK